MVNSGAFSKAAQKRAQSRNGGEEKTVYQPVSSSYTPQELAEREQILAGVAQRIEQSRPKGKIGGSIPLAGTQPPSTEATSPYQLEHPQSVSEQSGWNPYQNTEAQEPELGHKEPEPTQEPVSPQPKPQIPIESHHPHMSKSEKAQFLLLRSAGNFLVLISLYGVVATFGPALTSEVKYQVAQMRGIQYSVATPEQTPVIAEAKEPSQVEPGFGDILAGTTQQVLVPPDTQFSIVIPKIGATSKVFPNVDPTQESEFIPILQQGVAHARGTVFPGIDGNVYLFAHSTDNFWNVGRYNAIFYLIKELKPGDAIIVFFENKRFNYVVDRTEIKDPTEVDLLVKSQEPGQKQLIMQTCWPPGTTWKRLFVIAKPAS